MLAENAPILTISASSLLAKYEDVLALDISQLHAQGNIICVIGHNGSGKSTLIKTVLELHVPKRGNIKALYGEVLANKSVPPVKLIPENDMAFSPENGAVFADISVEAYLKLWCRVKLHSAKYYLKEGSSYIEQLSVTPLLPKLGRELSKGERRRVQTAVGFMCNPKLFLFDEPFDGLDILQASNFAALLKQECNKRTFLISSHRMSLVERISDLVIVLAKGKVVACGSALEVSKVIAERAFTIQIELAAYHQLSPVVSRLEKTLSPAAVSHLGTQVIVTGKNLSIESLERACRELGLEFSIITEAAPCLTDAMTYHLNSMISSFKDCTG